MNTKTRTAISPSNRSSNPPCPGRMLPESFTPETRFAYDSVRSPITETTAIRRPSRRNERSVPARRAAEDQRHEAAQTKAADHARPRLARRNARPELRTAKGAAREVSADICRDDAQDDPENERETGLVGPQLNQCRGRDSDGQRPTDQERILARGRQDNRPKNREQSADNADDGPGWRQEHGEAHTGEQERPGRRVALVAGFRPAHLDKFVDHDGRGQSGKGRQKEPADPDGRQCNRAKEQRRSDPGHQIPETTRPRLFIWHRDYPATAPKRRSRWPKRATMLCNSSGEKSGQHVSTNSYSE